MLVLLYFAATLFTSATLLFLVQPMIGKMILPRLGGTPAVWNTCMVFFQAVLLLGYGYTHFVSKLPKRRQLLIQALLLVMPLTLLPFSLGEWMPPADSNPVFSVLWILAIVVGVPFFVVSTTAPLLQKWFAFTGHPAASDPYFLYGASNLGSMLALVLYPVVMEPNFSLEPQTWIWSWGYGLFALLVLGSIAMVWGRATPQLAPAGAALAPNPSPPGVASETAISVKPKKKVLLAVPRAAASIDTGISWPRRLRWIALAAIPSSLMLGCTTYMTTDIAAIPFFWVLPLALYLLTFVIVFARWPIVWTAPAPKTVSRARTQASILVLAPAVLLIAIGVAAHVYQIGGAHPKVFGLTHLLYVAGFFLFFVFWVVSGTGGAHDFVLYFQPCFLLFLFLVLAVPSLDIPTWLVFALHLLSFFFTTLMCHGELAVDRPSTEHLTEFYLCMSIGGVLGGLLNAILAPLVFRKGIVEYPLAMIASCFVRPNLTTDMSFIPGDSTKEQPTATGIALDFALPCVLAASMFLAMYLGDTYGWKSILMAAPIVGVLALAMRPLRFGLSLALVWVVVALTEYYSPNYNYVFRDRSFFGLVKVQQFYDRSRDLSFNKLIHGGIDHGRQTVDKAHRHEPCAYFHPLTGIGQLFMKLTWPNTPLPDDFVEFELGEHPLVHVTRPKWRTPASVIAAANDPLTALAGISPLLVEPGGFDRVRSPYHTFTLPSWRLPASLVGTANEPWAALVTMNSEPPFAVLGLGTGTLAAYAKPYQRMDIYEIDPLVWQLSQWQEDTKDQRKEPPFTYVIDAQARGADVRIILGDGRKKIEQAPELWYHVICLDAFSSDAIPVHLLTVEAIGTYLKKLAPGGVLVFNTTNKYVDIGGVLKDAADHLDLECLGLSDWHRDLIPEKYGTDFVMLRRSKAAIAKLDTSFNGGRSLRKRIDQKRWVSFMNSLEAEYKKHYGPSYKMEWFPWKAPNGLEGELWTDRYSNLLGVLRLGPS